MNTKFNYFRICTIIPRVYPGEPLKNMEEIKKHVEEFDKVNDLIVFPNCALTGYTASKEVLYTQSFLMNLDKAIIELTKLAKYDGKKFIVGSHILTTTGKLQKSALYFSGNGSCQVLNDRDIVYIDKIPVQILIGNNSLPSDETIIAIRLSALPVLNGNIRDRAEGVRYNSGDLTCGCLDLSCGNLESGGKYIYSGSIIAAENGKILNFVLPHRNQKLVEDYVCSIVDFDIDIITRSKLEQDNPIIKKDSPIFNYTDDEIFRKISATPYVPKDERELYDIFISQSLALQRRIHALGNCKCVIGVSGGSDSTLALLVAAHAYHSLGLNPKNIIGISMPCFGTTERTKTNAAKLMEILGIDSREIPIGETVKQHLKDINHSLDVFDIAYENAQARIRTLTLFDISNMEGNCIVIGTGDLSECAVGWCTYGGDQFSSFNVNASIPKTQVLSLIEYISNECSRVLYSSSMCETVIGFLPLLHIDERKAGNFEVYEILKDIVKTPVSPELLPPDKKGKIQQLSENSVGPYELIDFFLYNYLECGYSIEKIITLTLIAFGDKYKEEDVVKWLNKFLWRLGSQQFKRKAAADSPITQKLGNWEMNSDCSLEEYIVK